MCVNDTPTRLFGTCVLGVEFKFAGARLLPVLLLEGNGAEPTSPV